MGIVLFYYTVRHFEDKNMVIHVSWVGQVSSAGGTGTSAAEEYGEARERLWEARE